MLQKIRDRLISGVFAIVMFGVIALAFVFWGVDFGSGRTASVATVNGNDVSMPEVLQAYRTQLNQMRQYYPAEIPAPVLAEVKGAVIENAVRRDLLVRSVQDAGYRIGDEALREQIRQNPSFQADGEFSGDMYRVALAQQGMNTAQFEARMRDALTVNQLQTGVRFTAFVTPSELRRLAALDKQQRDVSFLRLSAAKFSDSVTVDEIALALRYEDNKASYVTPATVTLEYLELKYDDYATGIEISEDQVRAAYDRQMEEGSLTGEERRLARHILVRVGDADDEAEKRAAADALLARISGGEDFAAVATETSDDTGSGANGGLLDWAERNTFVGPFADAVFSMAIDDIQGPIRTEFGYHIVRLEGVQAAAAKPFDEARADILAGLQQDAAGSLFDDLVEDVDRMTYEASDELESVAEANGLTLQTVAGVTAAGGPGIALNPQVREAAFSPKVLEDRENSDALEIETGHYVYLRVLDHTPSRQQTIDEVRGRLTAQLLAEAAQEQATLLGNRLLTRVRAGEPLDALATEYELTVEHKGLIGRTTAGTPPQVLTTAFKLPHPVAESVSAAGVPIGGDYALVVVSKVQLGAEAEAAEASQFAGRVGQGEFAAYIEQLRADARVRVRPEVLE